MRDIGKNIRDLRERSGLTQEALAEKLFVTRQTVSNYETGKTRPDLEMLLKISEILGVDANTLLYGLPVCPRDKRLLRQLILTGSVFLAILLLELILQPLAKRYANSTYLMGPSVLLNCFALPLLRASGGFCLGTLGKNALALKRTIPAWARWLCWGIVGIFGMGFVLMLPTCVYTVVTDILAAAQDSVSLSFSMGKILGDAAYGVLYVTLNAPPVWLLPGLALSLALQKNTQIAT